MPPTKICFTISEAQDTQIKALPRSVNLSEKLREALDKILSEVGVSI